MFLKIYCINYKAGELQNECVLMCIAHFFDSAIDGGDADDEEEDVGLEDLPPRELLEVAVEQRRRIQVLKDQLEKAKAAYDALQTTKDTFRLQESQLKELQVCSICIVPPCEAFGKPEREGTTWEGCHKNQNLPNELESTGERHFSTRFPPRISLNSKHSLLPCFESSLKNWSFRLSQIFLFGVRPNDWIWYPPPSVEKAASWLDKKEPSLWNAKIKPSSENLVFFWKENAGSQSFPILFPQCLPPMPLNSETLLLCPQCGMLLFSPRARRKTPKRNQDERLQFFGGEAPLWFVSGSWRWEDTAHPFIRATAAAGTAGSGNECWWWWRQQVTGAGLLERIFDCFMFWNNVNRNGFNRSGCDVSKRNQLVQIWPVEF